MEENLDKIHSVLFGILKEIAALCEKHNIGYFLDSGTLLGAVRHKDFIPWDDDADITMKREDYEKFRNAAKELPAPYLLVEPQDYNGYFFDFIPRVIHTKEPLREEKEEDRAQNNYQNRVSVDIFLIDSAPDKKLSFRTKVLRQKILYGEAMAHRFDRRKHAHSLSEKIKISVLGFFGKFHSLDHILKKQKKLSTSHNKSETNYYCISNTLVGELDKRYPKEAFDSFVRLPLRNTYFNCPGGYDCVLTTLYGDYMTPPPPADRHPTHSD